MALDGNRRGALWMVVSMTAFTCNDAFMKALGGEWPLFQSIFLRGVGVTMLALGLCLALGQFRVRLPRRDWGWLILRTGGEVGAAVLYLAALFRMPIADATAILQITPIAITFAGAVFLGEAVGWRRWLAVAVGFAGMMLIVRPGFDMEPAALLALGSVVAIVIRDLAARQMSTAVPSMFGAFVAAISVCAVAGVLSIGESWAPMTPGAAWQLGGAVGFILLAYVSSIVTVRHGDVSAVAPFRYTAILVRSCWVWCSSRKCPTW
ncbi:MAG: DMT family transporter [Shimia sp.]